MQHSLYVQKQDNFQGLQKFFAVYFLRSADGRSFVEAFWRTRQHNSGAKQPTAIYMLYPFHSSQQRTQQTTVIRFQEQTLVNKSQMCTYKLRTQAEISFIEVHSNRKKHYLRVAEKKITPKHIPKTNSSIYLYGQ